MNYSATAQGYHFFNFVFYETEKDTMYIYCPNCDAVHELDMKLSVPKYEKKKVNWIKENWSPCLCFDMRSVPKYCRSDREYSRVGTELDVGEFCKNEDGSVSVNVYRQKTNFAKSNYPDAYKPFKRHPIFEEEKTIVFDFREGAKTKIKTCLYTQICTNRIAVGYRWESAKNWRRSFVFTLVEQSLKELEGTYLEKYIPEIYKFQSALSDFLNMEEVPMGDYTVQFLRLLCENEAFRRVWKAGYTTLAINKVFESIMIGGCGYYTMSYYLCGNYINKKVTNAVINWRGKKLEKILKVNPQKLDNLIAREDLTLEELKGAIRLEKLGIEYNDMNLKIACTSSFDKLQEICKKESFSFSKVFKYIRHTKNRDTQTKLTYSDVVSDYYDYLDALIKLKTQLTSDVVFPTNLRVSHDRAIAQYKQLTDAEKDKVFKKAVAKYGKLNFENESFSIFLVDNIGLLQVEAQNLHNCSASYADRIIAKSSVIFLIRKIEEPDTPFYMLELNPKSLTIVQNRGLYNCGATDEVKAFADLWLNSVVLPSRKKLSKAAEKVA